MKQRVRVDNLFEKWDNEGSGYLDIEEIETIIHKYKDGLETLAIKRGMSCLYIIQFVWNHNNLNNSNSNILLLLVR